MTTPSRLFGYVLTVGLIVAAVATVIPTILLTASLGDAVGEELSAWREPADTASFDRERPGESQGSFIDEPTVLASIGVALFVAISFIGYTALALAYITRGDAPYAVMTLLQLVVFLIAALAFM